MLFKLRIFTACLLCLWFCAPKVKAPLKVKTLAVRFYDRVEGNRWEKMDAYKGFQKWPEYFGHTQQEIWDIIEKESEFKVHATSKVGAMGLMQPTRSAIRAIKRMRNFTKWKTAKNGYKYRVLNFRKIYSPYWNIYIGCKYLKRCKRMARPQKIGRFEFSKREIALLYYVTGYGNFHRRIADSLRYIQ